VLGLKTRESTWIERGRFHAKDPHAAIARQQSGGKGQTTRNLKVLFRRTARGPGRKKGLKLDSIFVFHGEKRRVTSQNFKKVHLKRRKLKVGV